MKSRKTLLTLLSCLTVFIAVMLLPMVTKAAPATQITISDGAPITTYTENVFGPGSNATFDPSTGTLSLNNTNFTCTQNPPFIVANGDLIIDCLGDNQIEYNGSAQVIYVNGGFLTINGDLIIKSAANAPCISCTGFNMVNSNVNIISTREGGNSNGAIYSFGGDANIVGNITISGFNGGITGPNNISINGNVNITNSTGTASHTGCGLYAVNGNITISGSTNSNIIVYRGIALWAQHGQVSISGDLTAVNTGDPTIWSSGDVLIYGEVNVVSNTVSEAIHTSSDIKVFSGSLEAHNMESDGSASVLMMVGENSNLVYPETYEISTPVGGYTTSGLIYNSDGTTAHAILISPKQYTVTVTNDGNGTGSASASTGISGETITLTATANAGYTLKEWQVISGGVVVNGNSFVIGTDNVVVKAVFEEGTSSESGSGEGGIADGNNGATDADGNLIALVGSEGATDFNALYNSSMNDLVNKINSIGSGTIVLTEGTALPNKVMKALANNPNVTLNFIFTKDDVEYNLFITGKGAANVYKEDIEWYGHIFLNNNFGKK